VRDESVEGPLGGARRSVRHVRRRIEAVERFRCDAARTRNGEALTRERDVESRCAGFASASAIDSFVSAVANSIAPYASLPHRYPQMFGVAIARSVEIEPRIADGRCARRERPVDLADDNGATSDRSG
jgi:hypothetical protein